MLIPRKPDVLFGKVVAPATAFLHVVLRSKGAGRESRDVRPGAKSTVHRVLGGGLALTCLLGSAAPSHAQLLEGQVRIDSIAVEGNSRVTREDVLASLSFTAGETVGLPAIQQSARSLMALGKLKDVTAHLLDTPDGRAILVYRVEEQPIIRRITFNGLEHADGSEIQDSAGLALGEHYLESQIVRARELIRSKLADEGIPFATVIDRVEMVPELDNVVDVILDVNEGSRVAVADVLIRGNDAISTEEIIGAMSTRPEGFWWWRGGGYDASRYEADLTSALPSLYASRGYLDFEVLSDTIVVDPTTGKARIELDVSEGPQYRIGRFTIEGNQRFEDEELEPFFIQQEGGLLRAIGIGTAGVEEVVQRGRVFDQVAFDRAVSEVGLLYRNQGYLFSQVRGTPEKIPPSEPGGEHTVTLTVLVQENSPAFINRITIRGNDYTHDWVIRDQILMLPGDVYSEQRIISSWQNIQALGFFDAAMPPPDIQPNEETGEVDVIFTVVERQTGAINFGTSVGGGVGLSGFIGYDHPNLFGQAKQGHLRWDFGRFLNNFTISFTDPALFRTRVSGTVSLFDARDRFFQFQSGERKRRGGSVRFGFPIPGWQLTRLFTGYSISRTKYQQRSGVDDTSLFGLPPGVQSQASAGLTRSSLNHPLFPYNGSRQSVNLEVNGGIFGGDGSFQRIMADGSWRIPVGQAGGSTTAAPGVIFSLGLALRAGVVFGDATQFPFDRFWMGGVNFGQQLRGYDETSITPLGFFPERSSGVSDIERLGDVFFSLTADYALRMSDNLQLSTFFDAGNVWAKPGNVDPTRLFRGAGFGLQIVTPFGPIGLDYAYGFDKTIPGWQFHFKMGQGF